MLHCLLCLLFYACIGIDVSQSLPPLCLCVLDTHVFTGIRCTWVCIHVWMPEVDFEYCSLFLSTLFLRQHLLLNLKLTIRGRLAGQQATRICCFHSHSQAVLRLQECFFMPAFMQVLGSKLRFSCLSSIHFTHWVGCYTTCFLLVLFSFLPIFWSVCFIVHYSSWRLVCVPLLLRGGIDCVTMWIIYSVVQCSPQTLLAGRRGGSEDPGGKQNVTRLKKWKFARFVKVLLQLYQGFKNC